MAILITTDIQKKAEEYFIIESLHNFAPELEDALIESAIEHKLKKKGDLQESIKSRLDIGNKLGYALMVSFETHGRFQDMGAGRSAKIENVDTNAIVYGLKPKRVKKRKPRKWYTRVVYGQISRLHEFISYGYAEETKQRIIKELLKIHPEGYFKS